MLNQKILKLIIGKYVSKGRGANFKFDSPKQFICSLLVLRDITLPLQKYYGVKWPRLWGTIERTGLSPPKEATCTCMDYEIIFLWQCCIKLNCSCKILRATNLQSNYFQSVRFWFNEDYTIKGVSSVLHLCNIRFGLNAHSRQEPDPTKFYQFRLTHPRHSGRKGQYKLRRDEDDKICNLSFPSHRSRTIYQSGSSKEVGNLNLSQSFNLILSRK